MLKKLESTIPGLTGLHEEQPFLMRVISARDLLSSIYYLVMLITLFLPLGTMAGTLIVPADTDVTISGYHIFERMEIQGRLILTGDASFTLTGPGDHNGRVLVIGQYGLIKQDFIPDNGYPNPDPRGPGVNGQDGYRLSIHANGDCVTSGTIVPSIRI